MTIEDLRSPKIDNENSVISQKRFEELLMANLNQSWKDAIIAFTEIVGELPLDSYGAAMGMYFEMLNQVLHSFIVKAERDGLQAAKDYWASK